MTPKKERWPEKFIAALADSGNVRAACEVAGIARKTAYGKRNTDLAFAAEWDAALEEACDTLEAEARRRAVEGVDKPVYQQGMKVGVIREYSDTLLIFLLKGNRPSKFKETVRQELTGKDGGAIQVANRPDLAQLSDEELAQLERMYERLASKSADAGRSPGGTGEAPA